MPYNYGAFQSLHVSCTKNLLWFLAQVYVVHHPFPLFFYHPPQVFLSWVNSEN